MEFVATGVVVAAFVFAAGIASASAQHGPHGGDGRSRGLGHLRPADGTSRKFEQSKRLKKISEFQQNFIKSIVKIIFSSNFAPGNSDASDPVEIIILSVSNNISLLFKSIILT